MITRESTHHRHPRFPSRFWEACVAVWCLGIGAPLCPAQTPLTYENWAEGFLPSTNKATSSNPGDSSLTYENWAEGFFAQTCCACHHSSKTGKERFGAPEEFNFDTLELIREQADDIRAVTLGDYRFMPPMGITWPWDRDNLEEWLDAGLPGEGDSLIPVETDRSQVSLHYQTSRFSFSQPLRDEQSDSDEKDFNYRYMRIRRKSDQDTIVPQDHRTYIRKQEDGTIVLEKEWWKDDTEGTRIVEYEPPLPILLNGGDLSAPAWSSPVQIHEREWSDHRTWKPPVYEATRTETWRVSVGSIERLDNGVMLPVVALKTVQTNLDTTEEITWWFAKGFGLVRKQVDSPSTEYERIRTIQYNIIRDDDPLRDPPMIESASTEWFPFVGPDYDPSRDRTENHRMDYSYQFDFQQIAVVDAGLAPDPTPTPPPLPEDPTPTPVAPTPTATPIGFGNPVLSPTEAPTEVPTAAPTEPDPGDSAPYSPDDPRISNLMSEDDVIDEKDLLIFLQHWHRSVK